MLLKTNTNNILDFCDFCLAVIFNYPVEIIYDQIVFGGKIKLIDLICENLTEHKMNKSWMMARDLGLVLE